MKNQEIALKAYAAAILKGSRSCRQDAWIAWRKSLGREVPEDYYECFLEFSEENAENLEWDDFANSPATVEYLKTYWDIQQLEGTTKLFKDYVESTQGTIANIKAGLIRQLNQE